jgi:hypothetical protein
MSSALSIASVWEGSFTWTIISRQI